MRFPIPSMLWPGRSSRRRSWAASRRPRRLTEPLLVEGLEPRRLLSVTINEFPVTKPTEILLSFDTVGPDGNIWFTELNGSPNAGIGRINVDTGAITDIPTGSRFINPYDLTTGPDGKVWFTDPPTTNSVRSTRRPSPSPCSPSRPLPIPSGSRRGPTATSGSRRRAIHRRGPPGDRSVQPDEPRPRRVLRPRCRARGDHGRTRRQPLVRRAHGQRDRRDQPDDARPRRVPRPHGRCRARIDRGRTRRQPLVRGEHRQQDRRDQPDDPRLHRVPPPHDQQPIRSPSRPGPTATSGSRMPVPPVARSVRSIRRPTPSPSSRSPRPAAGRMGSWPVPTAISGSPRKPPIRSGELDPATMPSPSSPSPRSTPIPTGSRPGPTATSGSPSRPTTRSASSCRRRASSRCSPSPPSAANPRGSRPGPTAISGSPSPAGNKIGRIDPTTRRHHRVPPPDRTERSPGHHGGPRRQPLVHRVRQPQDRGDRSDHRSHHGVRRRVGATDRPGSRWAPTATSGSSTPTATPPA